VKKKFIVKKNSTVIEASDIWWPMRDTLDFFLSDIFSKIKYQKNTKIFQM